VLLLKIEENSKLLIRKGSFERSEGEKFLSSKRSFFLTETKHTPGVLTQLEVLRRGEERKRLGAWAERCFARVVEGAAGVGGIVFAGGTHRRWKQPKNQGRDQEANHKVRWRSAERVVTTGVASEKREDRRRDWSLLCGKRVGGRGRRKKSGKGRWFRRGAEKKRSVRKVSSTVRKRQKKEKAPRSPKPGSAERATGWGGRRKGFSPGEKQKALLL